MPKDFILAQTISFAKGSQGKQMAYALMGIRNSCNVTELHNKYRSAGQPCQIYTPFVLCNKTIATQFFSNNPTHQYSQASTLIQFMSTHLFLIIILNLFICWILAKECW